MKDMISFRQLFSLIFSSVFLLSCAPYPPEGPSNDGILSAQKVLNPEGAYGPQTEIEKQMEANRQRLADKKKRVEEGGNGAEVWPEKQAKIEAASEEEMTPQKNAALPKKVSKYPTAVKTREGFVKNPYTGKEVDVRGIPSGRLVVDPDDPNQATNKFRVP